MTRLRPAVVTSVTAAVAMSVAGCGSGAKARDTRTASPRDARIAGFVRPCGGTTKVCYGVNTVAVSVFDANGLVASAPALARTDRFSFSLIPGRYTVVLKVNGGELAQAAVTASAHRTTFTDLANPYIH